MDAIEVRVEEAPALETDTLTSKLRPVPGGAKIETYLSPYSTTCALGFNLVAWVNGTLATDRYAVTVGHCVQPYETVSSTLDVGQPTNGFSGLAREVVDPPFFVRQTTAPMNKCPKYPKLCRFSDAVLLKYTFPDTAYHGFVAYPGNASVVYNYYTTVQEIITPVEGHNAYIIAPVSGRRAGEIYADCYNYYVPSTNYVYLCQSRADYYSQNHDSGSPIIEPLGDGSQSFALGIHVAHEVFSPLSAALWEIYVAATWLGVMDPTTSETTPPIPGEPDPVYPLQVSIGGPTTVGPNNYSCSVWAAIAHGGSTPYTYEWTGFIESTDGAVTGTVPFAGGDLSVLVVDAAGNSGYGLLHVTYDPNNQDYCE